MDQTASVVYMVSVSSNDMEYFIFPAPQLLYAWKQASAGQVDDMCVCLDGGATLLVFPFFWLWKIWSHIGIRLRLAGLCYCFFLTKCLLTSYINLSTFLWSQTDRKGGFVLIRNSLKRPLMADLKKRLVKRVINLITKEIRNRLIVLSVGRFGCHFLLVTAWLPFINLDVHFFSPQKKKPRETPSQ